MKRLGRPRKYFKAGTTTQVIQYPESGLPHSAPVIGSLVESGEFNLLDLPRLQTELENLLASATERMVCLSSELYGSPLPPSILRHLGLLKAEEESAHSGPPQVPSSLVVTANPNKPLSLIISSQRPQATDTQLPDERGANNENPGSLPVPLPAVPPPSATSRASNPAHDVPNRFWALMEPYCADITETNISYLESILKSYVEEATTAKYFQLPPGPTVATDHNLRSAHHSPDLHHVPKRPRRDCQKNVQNSSDSETQDHSSELSGALKAATEMVQLARCIDAQLKWPSLPSQTSAGAAAVEDLVHSIENELYQDNVSSVLFSAVTHMAKGEFSPGFPAQANCLDNHHHTNDCKSPCLLDAYCPPSPSKRNGGTGGGGTALPHFPDKVCDSRLTSLTSQPLKNLARQLQVSSSFRVEKKVAQAMEELGLFPLTLYLNHLAQRPSAPLLPSAHPPAAATAARWRSVLPPPSADCKTEPTTPPPRSPSVNNREANRSDGALTDSKTAHPAGEETLEPTSRLNGTPAPRSLPAAEKGRSLSTYPLTTAQPCTRNSRRKTPVSHKRSKSQSESPLLNGFATSEDGDEERGEDADGGAQEHEDEEAEAEDDEKDPVENGEPEKSGAQSAEEEIDVEDAKGGGSHGSTDADEEAEASGRPSAAVSRCLTEEFEATAATASDNPPSSPQHRASLRSPSAAASTTSTSSKRVCNAKKWLPSKQAVDASEATGSLSCRGSASTAKAGGGATEKSCAFADLLNSALDLVADGSQTGQLPPVSRCEGLKDLVATAPTDDDDDLSGCLLNLAAVAAAAAHATEQTGSGGGGSSDFSTDLAPSSSNSDLTLALLQRQRELRLVCAANHSVLHRLIQAARRDLQRQEIQRRLAIADADSSTLRNCMQRWAARAFSARFTGAAATSSTHLATACSRFRQKQNSKEQTYSQIPAAIASLTVPFLVSSYLHDDNEDQGSYPKAFPTVHCASAPVPPKPPIPPERLAAIKSLDVVADVVEDVAPAVVSLTSSGNFFQIASSTGSGFIVDDAGLIITNAHVVGHKQGLKVNMLDGRTFDARVLAVDVTSDLALVQIEADPDTVSKLPRMRLAPSSHDIRPGQFVIALGSPLMLSNTVTVGVISAVERDLGHREGLKYLQTDAIITFGNSGGPLVSLYGEVIGVNSMIADTGLGFAVPVDQVHRFIETSKRALANRGRDTSTPRQPGSPPARTPSQAPRTRSWSWSWSSQPEPDRSSQGSVMVGPGGENSRYLGLVMRTLTPDLAFELAMRDPFGRFTNRDVQSGVLIHGVIRGSPAERAGLLPGDIIVAIDGKQITNAAEVSAAVDKSESISLTVVRRGKRLDIPNVATEAV